MPDMNENSETQQEYLGKIKPIHKEDLQYKTKYEIRIDELVKQANDKISKYIAELEKENAELKSFRQDCVKLTEDNVVMARQRAEIAEQLTKAKGIILRLYNAGRDVLMCRAEEKAYDNLSKAINDKSIEQFLKEIKEND